MSDTKIIIVNGLRTVDDEGKPVWDDATLVKTSLVVALGSIEQQRGELHEQLDACIDWIIEGRRSLEK